MMVAEITYALWKQVAQNNSFTSYHSPDGADSATLWCGNVDLIYRADLVVEDYADWSAAFPTSLEVASEGEALAQIVGLNNSVLFPRSPRGYTKVEIQAKEAKRLNSITINYCDKTTWHPQSKPVVDEVMTDSGDLISWNPATQRPWIDVCHGKLTGERDLRAQYTVIVKVDDITKTENTPDQTDNDFSIDYMTGVVTFNAALASGSVVKASYYYENGSLWTIKPLPGKEIRITHVEVQLSENIDLTDTVIFEPYGPVEIYAPTLWDGFNPPGPYPTGTMLPLGGASVYQTMQDYINEAEKSWPSIVQMGGPGYRGMKGNQRIFRWEYESGTTDLSDTSKLEIRIQLENDIPFRGDVAIVTFYGQTSTDGTT